MEILLPRPLPAAHRRLIINSPPTRSRQETELLNQLKRHGEIDRELIPRVTRKLAIVRIQQSDGNDRLAHLTRVREAKNRTISL